MSKDDEYDYLFKGSVWMCLFAIAHALAEDDSGLPREGSLSRNDSGLRIVADAWSRKPCRSND